MKTKVIIMTKDVYSLPYTLDEEKGDHIFVDKETGILVIDKPHEGKVWFNKDNWCNVAMYYGEE